MSFKWLLFPIFVITLFLANVKAVLVFALHPLIKHRFFSFSLIILVIYLAFFYQVLVKNPIPQTVRLSNYQKSLNTLSVVNFNRFQKLQENLALLEEKTGGTTLIYLNLALSAHYQGQTATYQHYWDLANNLDPNHPIFQ